MSHFEGDEELTRKQRREQARADRKAMEEAAAADAARRKRLTSVGVVVAIVVVAVVAILIATSSGGKSAPKAGTNEASKVTAEVNNLVGGIPQTGNSLGSPTAPVTLQYYGDLECPICQKFTLGALPSLIQNWVRAGKLRIEYKSLETATREPETFKTQQAAALAAGKQAKMWNFIETFYHEQGAEDSGYVTEQYLHNLARQVTGLNLVKWSQDRTNPHYASEIEADAQSANAHNFTGTPSFLIGHTGGTPQVLEYTSLEDPTGFNQAIEHQLKS
jgi:protein-disulfide isomerase